MFRNLLVCGLVAGLVAGIAAFGFATVAGEPAVDQAIRYEEAHAPPPKPGEHERVLVSRDTQKGFGLLTATTVYGLSLGGLFALAFGLVYGRVGRAGPMRTALWLAAAAFVVVYLIPFVKYPPNPPAVGSPDTIGERTALYLSFVVISLLAAIAAVRAWRMLATRMEPGSAVVLAGLGFLAIVTIAGIVMPGIHELPSDFPASTLWDFREASVGTQAVTWTTIGLIFAPAAARVMEGRPAFSRPRRAERVAAAGE